MEIDTTPIESEKIVDVSFCLSELGKNHKWKESLRKDIEFSNRSFWVAMNQYCNHPNYIYKTIGLCEVEELLNEKYQPINEEIPIDEKFSNTDRLIRRRTIHSKLPDIKPVQDFVIFDKSSNSVTFFPIEREQKKLPFYYPQVDMFRYRYEPKESKAQFLAEAVFYEDYSYLTKIPDYPAQFSSICEYNFEKFNKWGKREDTQPYKKRTKSDTIFPHKTFFEKYMEMKKKYRFWVKEWPEQTSPQKYIYEELAIASYLICIWNSEENKKPKFADMGCGNGFLTAILTSEGYEGYGIDITERKIWKVYPQHGVNPKLKCEVLEPNTFVPGDVEWLIGNHSDELTPWIPYIASKSPNIKFFLLPCCFFDFGGKYKQSVSHDIGRYHSYLNYIEQVGKKLGFDMEKDTMRIPSTKNIAFVARRRLYVSFTEEQPKLDLVRAELLKEGGFTGDFKPRESDKQKQEQLDLKRKTSLEQRKAKKIKKQEDVEEVEHKDTNESNEKDGKSEM